MKCRHVWKAALLAVLLGSCSNTDCPLNNTVSMQAGFYLSATGAATNVTDTMSVTAVAGINGVTLYNRLLSFQQLALPVGYVQTVDTLLFQFRTPAGSVNDTVCVYHTNIPHFVSLDCSTAFFHTITKATCTRRTPTADFPTALDSISIVQPNVTYDTTENLRIYFSTY